jgi:hypothetical protein
MITSGDLLVIGVVGIFFVGAIAIIAPILYHDYSYNKE